MSACTCGKALGRRNQTGLCRPCFTRTLNTGERAEKRIASLRATLAKPEMREIIVKQRTLASRSRMAWCPIEYRDEYRRLTRVKMLTAFEAQAAVCDLIAADAARYARTGSLQQSRRAG